MQYNRSGQKWVFQEDEILRKYFLEGKSISEIAQKLGRDEDAIVFRLIKIGILGYTEREIPGRHGLSWLRDELEQLKEEYKQGLSIEEIAQIHKRQKNSILYNLIKLRLFDITNRDQLEKFRITQSFDSQEISDSNNEDIENNGGSKMGFKTVSHKPKTIDEEPSVGGTLSGRNDAIFLKNKYQAELDGTWDAIINMVHHLETKNSELKEVYAKIPAIKKNIEAHEKERTELYTNLGNVLTKETDFEDKMWKETQKGRKVKSVTIKQKFKDSDVDEMRYDSMLEYLKQYPEYASKSTFRKILDKIEQKELEIRKETEKYNEHISDYNFRLNDFGRYIQKAEDKFEAYNRIKKEAENKLNGARYNKSVLNKFRSEKSKAETNLDLLHHRVEQFEHTLEDVKEEHSRSKRKMFEDMQQ